MAPAVFAYNSRFVCILEKGMSSTSAMRFRTPNCGLVRNDHRDVFESQTVDAENLPNAFGHRCCGLLLNRFSVHCEIGVTGDRP